MTIQNRHDVNRPAHAAGDGDGAVPAEAAAGAAGANATPRNSISLGA